MSDADKKLNVCRVATVPIAVLGHKHQFEELSEIGVSITLVCSKGKGFEKLPQNDLLKLFPIELKREISPISDLISIFQLFMFFKNNNFDIVHSNTPKAGVLVAISAWLAAVPIRIHTFTGQRWVSTKGLKKHLLVICDKLISMLNTHSFTDSHSQREFLIQSNILSALNSSCLGRGSFSGINTEKFNQNKVNTGAVREKLSLHSDDLVIGYIGRIVKDKGIDDLVEVYQELKEENKNIKLLLVGPEETESDFVDKKTKEIILKDPNIITTGHVSDPENYLGVMNLFVLPSRREGFPTVILEANALKIPSIASDIVGTRDTIVDGVTGFLTPLNNNDALKEKIKLLLTNKELAKKFGEAGFQRVNKEFSSKKMTSLLATSYLNLKRHSHV